MPIRNRHAAPHGRRRLCLCCAEALASSRAVSLLPRGPHLVALVAFRNGARNGAGELAVAQDVFLLPRAGDSLPEGPLTRWRGVPSSSWPRRRRCRPSSPSACSAWPPRLALPRRLPIAVCGRPPALSRRARPPPKPRRRRLTPSGISSSISSQGDVPFVFMTGSTRLGFECIRYYGNTIVDTSGISTMATAVGYSWEEIVRLYPLQPRMLEVKHGVTRAQLQASIAEWHDGCRWSTESSKLVLNPHSIHQLMVTGEFRPHWASDAKSALLFNTGTNMQEIVELALGKQAATTRTVLDAVLGATKIDENGNLERELQTRKAVLRQVCSPSTPATENGVAASHTPIEPKKRVALRIPCLDSKAMLTRLLDCIPASFSPLTVNGFVVKGGFLGLLSSRVTQEMSSGFLKTGIGCSLELHRAERPQAACAWQRRASPRRLLRR